MSNSGTVGAFLIYLLLLRRPEERRLIGISLSKIGSDSKSEDSIEVKREAPISRLNLQDILTEKYNNNIMVN